MKLYKVIFKPKAAGTREQYFLYDEDTNYRTIVVPNITDLLHLDNLSMFEDDTHIIDRYNKSDSHDLILVGTLDSIPNQIKNKFPEEFV